jgi:hypothetical protein
MADCVSLGFLALAMLVVFFVIGPFVAIIIVKSFRNL